MTTQLCFLNSNDGTSILALGQGAQFRLESKEELPALDAFLQTHASQYIFGYLSYELHGHIYTTQKTEKRLPLAYFWVPENVASIKNEGLELLQGTNAAVLQQFLIELKATKPVSLAPFRPRTSKSTYLENVAKIKDHIQRGDLYETNYCQEFFLEDCVLPSSLGLYQWVNQQTTAPFSGLFTHDDLWLACGSPERFLKKEGNKIKSQPIKGTSPRFKDPLEDAGSKQGLHDSKKEKAENVMIVDLVRNDLSKIALPTSVKVDELFGIYSFKTVHQMISTVSCEVRSSTPFSKVLEATFPMGSMTGAPKRNAVKYMHEMEDFNREIYSGSLGYFKPGGDFDFNVVIRSLAYYPKDNYLSCGVGSAITMPSDALQEYHECLLKIKHLISIESDEIR